jgi:ABC-type glycerol-3-phosphate transport system substrate-binding protein
MTLELEFFLRHFDAQPVQGTPEAPTLHFTDPAVVQGAQYYVDLLQNYSPHERLTGYTQESAFDSEPFQLLQEGRIGMWFGLGFSFGLAENENLQVAIAPPPLEGLTISVDDVQVSGQYIAAQSEHPEACWQWLTFLSGQPSIIYPQESVFPARISVATSPEFAEQGPAGVADVYAAYRERFDDVVTDGNTREALSLFGSVVDPYWFYRAVDRALQGEDLERELQAAQEMTQQFVECVQIEEDANTCATTVDPDYKGFSTEDVPQAAE